MKPTDPRVRELQAELERLRLQLEPRPDIEVCIFCRSPADAFEREREWIEAGRLPMMLFGDTPARPVFVSWEAWPEDREPPRALPPPPLALPAPAAVDSSGGIEAVSDRPASASAPAVTAESARANPEWIDPKHRKRRDIPSMDSPGPIFINGGFPVV